MTDELKQEMTEKFNSAYGKEVRIGLREALRKVYIDGGEYGYQYALQHPQWIPVEERLPKENERIIAYNGVFNEIHLCDFHDGIFEDFYGPFDGTITHWMPMPMPPQPNKKDEKGWIPAPSGNPA